MTQISGPLQGKAWNFPNQHKGFVGSTPVCPLPPSLPAWEDGCALAGEMVLVITGTATPPGLPPALFLAPGYPGLWGAGFRQLSFWRLVVQDFGKPGRRRRRRSEGRHVRMGGTLACLPWGRDLLRKADTGPRRGLSNKEFGSLHKVSSILEEMPKSASGRSR